MAHLAGNHVMLRCVDPSTNPIADVLLGHMRPASVRVRPGASGAVDDWLGSVGNSDTTGEPHLHLHAQHPGPGGAPLSVVFDGRFPVRGDRIESP